MAARSSETTLHLRRLLIFADPPLAGGGVALRQAVTARFPDEPLLHNHAEPGGAGGQTSAGGYDYRAPRVRYLIRDGIGEVVGWGDGADLLDGFPERLDRLRIGPQEHRVLGTELHDLSAPFGRTDEPRAYRTLTPWLALNEQNASRFEALDGPGRRALLSRILVGNLLALAKSVGHWVDGRIGAEIASVRVQPVRHKGIRLIGIRAHARVNFALPPLLGIGKLASKGYGVWQPLSTRNSGADIGEHE